MVGSTGLGMEVLGDKSALVWCAGDADLGGRGDRVGRLVGRDWVPGDIMELVGVRRGDDRVLFRRHSGDLSSITISQRERGYIFA